MIGRTNVVGNGEVEIEDITIQPSVTQQVVNRSEGKYINSVTVEAVTSEIDENITPTNIRAGVTVLGVEGNLQPDKPDQTKTATPTTIQQVITADTGYELSSVIIPPVTSDIDENITAGNIKKDVSILGVIGEYEGEGDSGGAPLIVTTDDEMMALLNSDNAGKIVQFAGVSDIYEEGALYLIEEEI